MLRPLSVSFDDMYLHPIALIILAFVSQSAAQSRVPVEWVPLDLVPTNVGGAAIAAQPPHPHAALLLADYLLAPAGKRFWQDTSGSATQDLGFKRWRPDHGISTEKYERTWNVGETTQRNQPEVNRCLASATRLQLGSWLNRLFFSTIDIGTKKKKL